jgi:hypothetical protein
VPHQAGMHGTKAPEVNAFRELQFLRSQTQSLSRSCKPARAAYRADPSAVASLSGVKTIIGKPQTH